MGKPKLHKLYAADERALSDLEVNVRLERLLQIIDNDANQEINQMCVSADSNEDLRREMATEPKIIIDEWVEKVREYTEKQTLIRCARLKRVAKLEVLEAFYGIRDTIKNEAREAIKNKINVHTQESDNIFGRMLYQGLIRLMESIVLVHTAKRDIKRVERHYNWAIKKYEDETKSKLKLLTSKHPLKDIYYGRIVLSDRKSLAFVDVNLHKSVDKIADEVFTQIVGAHGKYKNPLIVGIKNLKQAGYRIMPKGPNITNARLDILLSQMRGDPRTQVPVFHLADEPKKEVANNRHAETAGLPIKSSKRKVTIPYVSPVNANAAGNPLEPAMSVVPPKYAYRHQEDSFIETTNKEPSRDLYNLDNAPSSIEIIAIPEENAAPAPTSKFLRMPSATRMRPKMVAISPDRPNERTSLRSGGYPAPKSIDNSTHDRSHSIASREHLSAVTDLTSVNTPDGLSYYSGQRTTDESGVAEENEITRDSDNSPASPRNDEQENGKQK